MAQSIGKVSIELEAKVAKLESDLKKAASGLEREMSKMRHMTQKSMADISTKTEQAGKKIESSLSGINKSMRSAFDFTVVAMALRGLQRTADEYSNISARVKLAAGANAVFKDSMAQILKVSMTTYQSLDATARLTQKISQGLQSTGVSAKDSFSKAIELTEVFNKALVVSGAGTIQAQSAMLQFSQAISKGKLDGDEFRSVMETNGAFMALLAKTLGVTTGELYKLREQGKLTNDVLFQVTGNAAELEKQFASFPLTITRSMENLNSAFTVFLGQADQAAGASRALAESIAFVAKNLDTIADVAVSGGAIYLLVGAFEKLRMAAVATLGTVGASNAIWAEMKAGQAAVAQASIAAAQATQVEIAAKIELNAVSQSTIRSEMLAQEAKIAASQAIIRANQAILISEVELAAFQRTAAATATMATLPMQIRLREQAVAAIAKQEAATASIVAAQTVEGRSAGALGVLYQRLGMVRQEHLALMTKQVLANSALVAGETMLIRSTVTMAGAMASLRAAGAGLFMMIGGWPTVIAAAAVATYFIVDAFLSAEDAADKFGVSVQNIHRIMEEAGDIDLSIALGENVDSSRIEASIESTRAAANDLQQQIFDLNTEIADLSGRYDNTSVIAAELANKTNLLAAAQKALNLLIHNAVNLTDDLTEARRREKEVNDAIVAGGDYLDDLKKENAAMLEKIVLARGGIKAAEALKRASIDQSKLTKGTNEAIDQEVALKIELTRQTEELAAAKKADTKATKDGEAAQKADIKLLEDFKEAQAEVANDLASLSEDVDGGMAKAWLKMADAVHAAWVEYKTFIDIEGSDKLRDNRVKAATQEYLDKADAVKKAADALAFELDLVSRAQDAHAEEAAGLGLVGKAAFVYAETLRYAAKAKEQFAAGHRVSADLLLSEKEAIEASAGALYDLGIASDNAAEIADDFQKRWVDAAHNVGSAFANFFTDVLFDVTDFENAWEDLGDSLVDIIKQSVGDMINEFLKLQIVNPILNSIFSNFGGAALPQAQGGGLFGNIASMLGGNGGNGMMSSVLGTVGGWFGMGGSTAAAQGSGFGAGAMAASGEAVGTASGAGLVSGSGMSTAFAGIPIIGWIAAGVLANISLIRQGWSATGGSTTLPNGQTVSGGGTSVGFDALLNTPGLVDRLLTSVGLGRLAIGSGISTRLFGRKAPRLTGSSTNMTIGAEGAGGSVDYRTIEEGGVFRSDRRRTHHFALEDEAQAAVEEMMAAVAQTMRDAAQTMQGEAPEMISAALRVVQEFDSKGKVTATKYFVDILGRSWEEATEEAASQRIHAEAIIATIDSILGTTVAAVGPALDPVADAIIDSIGDIGRDVGAGEGIVKTEGLMGEASAIAERWREDAEMLMEGAEFLLMAATDIHAGVGLLGDGGSLTQVADLIEELNNGSETLSETYARVVQSTNLLSDAVALQGITLGHTNLALELTREEFVRFATEITEAAGGLDRARELWTNYFDTFFTAGERAQLALSRAQVSLGSELGDIGHKPSDYSGAGGLARFRADFEAAQIAGLTAEATVEWLEAGEALARVTAAQAAYNETLTEATESEGSGLNSVEDSGLATFMRDIDDSINSFGVDGPNFGQMLDELTAKYNFMIEQAIKLGANEEQIGRIRMLYQMEYWEIVEQQLAAQRAQAQAARDLASYVLMLNAETANGGSLPSYIATMQDIREQYESHVDQLNELAVASGRASASEEELAAASNWLAAQIAAAVAQLLATGRDLVQQLYGSTGAEQGNTFFGSEMTGIGQVEAAVEDRYAREMELLKGLAEYLDSLKLSSLSPLTPEERLLEAQSQYETLLAAAMGGDLDALEQLQGAANDYLTEAQSYYGGVGGYSNIFANVTDALQALVDRGPLNEPTDGGPTEVTGPGGGGVTTEPGEGWDAQAAAEREALANELAMVMRDIMMLTGDSLLEVADQLGLDLRDLVADLGANLDELTVETTLSLVDIADTLGVSLQELAESVGFELGELADQNSLISQALAGVITGLPTDIAGNLQQMLAAIRSATTAAGIAGSTAEMTAYMNTLPSDIRDALDEFFPGVITDEEAAWAATIATATNTGNIKSAVDEVKSAVDGTSSAVSTLWNNIASTSNAQLEIIANESAFSNLWLAAISAQLTPPPPPPAPVVTLEPGLLIDIEEEDAQQFAILQQLKAMDQRITNAIIAGNNTAKEHSDTSKGIKRVLEQPVKRGV